MLCLCGLGGSLGVRQGMDCCSGGWWTFANIQSMHCHFRDAVVVNKSGCYHKDVKYLVTLKLHYHLMH